MYCVEKYVKGTAGFDRAVADAKFSKEQVEKASRLEWWGSSLSDPGPDFNLFRLYDGADKVVAEQSVAGYWMECSDPGWWLPIPDLNSAAKENSDDDLQRLSCPF